MNETESRISTYREKEEKERLRGQNHIMLYKTANIKSTGDSIKNCYNLQTHLILCEISINILIYVLSFQTSFEWDNTAETVYHAQPYSLTWSTYIPVLPYQSSYLLF